MQAVFGTFNLSNSYMHCTWFMLVLCVVPENIHTPPTEDFLVWPPSSLKPLQKFYFSVILSFQKLGFWNPPPLGISINLPWSGHGYFLELPNLGTCIRNKTNYWRGKTNSHLEPLRLPPLQRISGGGGNAAMKQFQKTKFQDDISVMKLNVIWKHWLKPAALLETSGNTISSQPLKCHSDYDQILKACSLFPCKVLSF